MGGIVVCGLGEVKAYTLAAERESAKVLNSATGVIWLRLVSASRVLPGACLIKRKGGSAMSLAVFLGGGGGFTFPGS